MTIALIVDGQYWPVLVKGESDGGWFAIGNVAESNSRDARGRLVSHLDQYSRDDFFYKEIELRRDFAFNNLSRGRKELRTVNGHRPKLAQEFFVITREELDRLSDAKLSVTPEGRGCLLFPERVALSFRKLPRGRVVKNPVFATAREAQSAFTRTNASDSEALSGWYRQLEQSCRGAISGTFKESFSILYWMQDGSVLQLTDTPSGFRQAFALEAEAVKEYIEWSEVALSDRTRIL